MRHKALAVAAALCLLLGALFFLDARVVISIMAGALTGLLEGMVMFPFENIKIQQQLAGGSVLEVATRTFSTHGPTGFYRGLPPVLIGAIPTQAIRWGTYKAYCRFAPCETNLWHASVGGLLTGILNSLVTGVPVETMKTSLIHSYFSYQVSEGAALPDGPQLYFALSPAAEKSMIPFRGWLPTLLKKIINQTMRFPLHSWFLTILCAIFSSFDLSFQDPNHIERTISECQRSASPLFNFIAGTLAGLCSIIVTHPIDVAKTRMQGLDGGCYRHFGHCLLMILQNEGAMAFSKGIAIRSFRAGIGAGVTFAVFPIFNDFLLALFEISTNNL